MLRNGNGGNFGVAPPWDGGFPPRGRGFGNVQKPASLKHVHAPETSTSFRQRPMAEG
jgi:hypothetical protein